MLLDVYMGAAPVSAPAHASLNSGLARVVQSQQ